MEAWYLDESNISQDQTLPGKYNPNKPVSSEELNLLGVRHWKLNGDTYEHDPVLEKIRQEGHYNYLDIVTVHRDSMPNYDEKLKAFYEEHLHLDDEIRYILDGVAYFDIRDQDDKWIRIFLSKGIMILLPAGIYHRFTPDKANYTKAMRLFSGEPQWKAYSRPADHLEVRKKYLKSLKNI